MSFAHLTVFDHGFNRVLDHGISHARRGYLMRPASAALTAGDA